MARPYKVEWNPGLSRYAFRTPKGGYGILSEEKVRNIIDNDIDVAGARMGKTGSELKKAAQQLKDGSIDRATYEAAVESWRDSMASQVKAAHAGQAAAAVGGIGNMGQREHGRVGGLLRREYAYLSNAAAEFAADPDLVLGNVPGRQGVDERGIAYAESSRYTYERFSDIYADEHGTPWVVNILEKGAHHCRATGKQQPHESCPGQTALGPIRVTDPRRIPSGRRICGPYCKCNSRHFKTKAAAMRIWRETKALWGWT